jgi:hypothetical protein
LIIDELSDDDFKKRMAGNAHFTTRAAFTFADTGSLLAVESQATTVVGATHCTNTVLAVDDEKAENDEESKPFLRKSCTYYITKVIYYDYTVTVTTK